MPVEVREEVTSSDSGPVGTQTTQVASSHQVMTKGEVQDAHSDRGNAWIWYVVGLVDLLLLLRIVFKLFGAKSVGFADFLYGITDIFVAPFRGIFSNVQVDKAYFDSAALLAIAVIALIGWAISKLIDLMARPVTSDKV